MCVSCGTIRLYVFLLALRGLRYVLLTASVIHHLPVVSHDDMHVLLAAINLFTETGQLWDARTWSQKLGRKLSLYHWSTPVTTLPPEHAEFANDPQVSFSSCQFDGADLCPPSSTVTIEKLVDEEGNKDSSLDIERRKPTNSLDAVSEETLPVFSYSFTRLSACFFNFLCA